MLAAIGVAMLGGIAVTASSAQASGGGIDHQAWICKYSGTPYVNEKLKDGKQPILTDVSATTTPDDPTLFKDGQSQSFVLALATKANTGRGKRYTGGLTCPAPRTSFPVTPPAYTSPSCDAPSAIIPPVDTAYYTWVLNKAGDTYTAVPRTVGDSKVPYTLSGETSFPVIKGGPDTSQCPGTITPTPPAYTPATCNAPRTIIGPVAGAHYTWALDESGKNWVAHAADNYTLAEGDWSYPATKGQPDTSLCPTTVVPPPPAIVPPSLADVPPVVAPTGEVKGVVKDAPVKAAPVKAAPVKAAPVVKGVVKDAVKTLAFTGAETVPLSLSGLLALLLGAVLTVASRQRPKKARE